MDYRRTGGKIYVRLTPADTPRKGQDVVSVVDVSGSMGTEQSIVTSQGRESHGFSTLDIVRHSLKAQVQMLQPGDRFALVAYHTDARLALPLTVMTPEAKKGALEAIDRLTPLNSTNIYGGLEQAFKAFGDEGVNPNRIRSVILMSDGVNNCGPAEGPLEALQNYIARCGLPAQVSINGFGTETDPDLMRRLADVGCGQYFFTMDASMVGTTSVNYMANLAVTAATKVVLTAGGREFKVNTLLNGQPTYVRFESDSPLELQVRIPGEPSQKITIPAGDRETGTWTAVECSLVDFRMDIGTTLRKALALAAYNLAGASELLTALARQWSTCVYLEGDVGHQGLFKDLTGELLASFQSGEAFRRWGKNYVLAMETALANGKQTNFKDESLKMFSSPEREKEKTRCNAIFADMPVPSRSAVSIHSQAAPVSAAAYNSTYNNSDDPCFAGWSMVRLFDGRLKRVDAVEKGDRMANGAPILAVIQTYTTGTAPLVHLQRPGEQGAGLWVTPYHPIRTEGDGIHRVAPRLNRTGSDTWQRSGVTLRYDRAPWHFPCELGPVRQQQCPALYSFVMSSGHTMEIAGFECITLGHGFQEDKARHDYLGGEAVIRDLAAMPGFEEGLVRFLPGALRRNKKTGLINGWKRDRAIPVDMPELL
jgi:Mg-chelatase subunit ChlD